MEPDDNDNSYKFFQDFVQDLKFSEEEQADLEYDLTKFPVEMLSADWPEEHFPGQSQSEAGISNYPGV